MSTKKSSSSSSSSKKPSNSISKPLGPTGKTTNNNYDEHSSSLTNNL